MRRRFDPRAGSAGRQTPDARASARLHEVEPIPLALRALRTRRVPPWPWRALQRTRFADAASRLLAEDLSLVVLGSGDPGQESMFRALAQAYPDRVGVQIGYDTGLSHRIEAGADIVDRDELVRRCPLGGVIYDLVETGNPGRRARTKRSR